MKTHTDHNRTGLGVGGPSQGDKVRLQEVVQSMDELNCRESGARAWWIGSSRWCFRGLMACSDVGWEMVLGSKWIWNRLLVAVTLD